MQKQWGNDLIMNNETVLPNGIKPSESLLAYNTEIKNGLQAGLKFTKLLDVFLGTKSANDLLEALGELLRLQLGSTQVTFPHQYQANDWYQLFMTRVLEMYQMSDFSLVSATDHEELGIFLAGTGTKVRYQFTQADINGAFFTEIETGKRLFYLDLKKAKVIFNSADIIDLFIVQETNQITGEESELAMYVLKTFAQLLANELGFKIDYSILETNNDYHFETVSKELSSQILDKLFIASAKVNVLMQPVEKGYGAKLILNDELELKFLQNKMADKSFNGGWYFEVIDTQAKASFFNILASYPFLQRWYLENRKVLEINPITINTTDKNVDVVEVLMPHNGN